MLPAGTPVIREYQADSHSQAVEAFQRDAIAMAQAGYRPTSQHWAADDAGRGCFWILIIVILLVTIVGILLLPFVWGSRNRGTLTVTYMYYGPFQPPSR